MREELVRGLQGPVRGLPPGSGLKPPDTRPVGEVRTAVLTADLTAPADGAAAEGIDVELRFTASKGQGEDVQAALVAMKSFLASAVRLAETGEVEQMPPVIAREAALALRAAR